MAQDVIISALIGLVGACGGNPKTENTDAVLIRALSAPPEDAEAADMVRAEKNAVSPGCAVCAMPCGNTSDYDIERIYSAEPEIRELKLRLIESLRQAARRAGGSSCPEFFYRALACLGSDAGKETLKELLDEAANFA